MARWKFLMLAGFLGWPAVSVAQTGPGGYGYGQQPPLPPGAMPPSMMTNTPNTLPPGVPALPGRLGMQPQQTLPGPTPVPGQAAPRAQMPGMPGNANVNMPDVTGMPHADMSVFPGSFPPGTVPPVPPQPCCPPPPEPADSTGGPSGLFFKGEFLYLKARRMDPVALLNVPLDTVSTATALINYDTNYHPAYRLGGGYLDRSGWLFQADYTRFKDTVANQFFVNDTTTASLLYVGPGLLGSLVTLQPGSLTAQWNLNYQTLDVMAGAVFTPSDAIDIIVTGGARYANIDQRYVTIGDATAFGGGLNSEDLESTLRGAGPRIGSEARLRLTGAWQVYGRAHTSILLAQRDEHSVVQQPGSTTFVNYTRNELLPTLELATGLEVALWDGLIIGCGYEWNYFFELGSTNVEFAGNARLNRHVDLGLEGATLRVSFLW